MLMEEPPTSVAIATLLPPFWPANSRVWFFQVEAQFDRRGIATSITKYEEVVCALPTEYATEVEDLLDDPPGENPYEKIKEQLTSRIDPPSDSTVIIHLTPYLLLFAYASAIF